MIERSFIAGAFIFRPGDPGDRAYLIREGKVELLRGEVLKRDVVAEFGPGEVFGEMSLIEERPRSLTARCVNVVKAATLNREEFEEMLTSDPATFRTYLKAIFERLALLAAPSEDALVAEPAEDVRSVQVIIHPLTRKAAETLPDDGLLIPKFPFRIGRASAAGERESLDLNDLWLLDIEPFNISRNHAVIDFRGDDVIIKDRGSQLGMCVNELSVGGRRERRQTDLVEGDNVVTLGGPMSPYQFRITVRRAPPASKSGE